MKDKFGSLSSICIFLVLIMCGCASIRTENNNYSLIGLGIIERIPLSAAIIIGNIKNYKHDSHYNNGKAINSGYISERHIRKFCKDFFKKSDFFDTIYDINKKKYDIILNLASLRLLSLF